LPLRFEANHGHGSAGIDFVARGASGVVLLRPQGAVLKPHGASAVFLDYTRPISLAGPEPLDALPSQSNYFLGPDPSQWRIGVLNFGRVRYRRVWPGIDLVWYGAANHLEYDIVVAPGADPRAAGFTVRGSGPTRIAANGDLMLGGTIRQHKPRAYQETPAGRRFIAAGYAVDRSGRVRFRIGPYDRSLPLIIDPVISYSTMFGGSGNDRAAGIAVDSAGNTYITGTTDSTDLPAGVAGSRFQGAPPDVFVAKIKPDGMGLVYCTISAGRLTISDPVPSWCFPCRCISAESNAGTSRRLPSPVWLAVLSRSARASPAGLSGTVDAVLSIGGIRSQPGVTLEVQSPDATPASSRPRPLRRVGR
jgi:hypothetical protein